MCCPLTHCCYGPLCGFVLFWNTLVEAPAGSLHRAVAKWDWADAVDGQVQNWAWSLHRTLCDLGYHLPIDRQHMPPNVVNEVLAMHAVRKHRSWEGLDLHPRTCTSARAHHCKYLRWFALPATTKRSAFLMLRYFAYRKCARFSSSRLGVTAFPLWLGSTNGRPSPVRPLFACFAIWAPLATSLCAICCLSVYAV